MRSHLLLLFTFLLITLNVHAQEDVTSKIAKMRAAVETQTGEAKVNSLNTLSNKVLEMKQPRQATKFAQEAFDLATQINFQEGIANANDQLGFVYQSKYDYENAMEKFVAAQKIRDASMDKKGIATSKNNIGKAFLLQGDTDNGELNLIKALETRREIADKEGLAETHKNLADLYLAKQVYGKARENYEASLGLRTELKDFKGAAAIASHLGTIVSDLGDTEGALIYYRMSVDMNSSINDMPNLGDDFNNIAKTHIEQENWDEAMDANEKAMGIRETLKDQLGVAECKKNSGIIANGMGNTKEANKLLIESVKLLAKTETAPKKQGIYRDVSKAFYKMKDYKNAYRYQMAYTKEKETFFNKEKATALLELTTKYESEFEAEKQEQVIANLEQEQTYNQKFKYFLFALLGLGGLFMASLFSSYNRKKKDNAKLRSMNDEITAKNLEIDSQNDLLQEKNDNLDVLNGKLVDEMAERESIEKSSFARDRFLATMSHEMKTPMNIITGLTHLLLDEKPREDQVKHLRTLQFSANNLVVYINDILDFSKIEAGRITLDSREFSLKNRFEDIKNRYAMQAKEKGLDFTCNIDSRIPENVIGDPVRLDQIMTNLVSNAVKHTEKGTVEVDVKLDQLNKKDSTVIIKVKDTGVGMKPEVLEEMFRKFDSSSNDIFEGYGSSGFGLVITKRLVDLQNGKIEVDSKIGEGTVITMHLPFKVGKTSVEKNVDKTSKNISSNSNNTKAKVNLESKFGHLKGNRILLVEDNKINQLVVAKLLRKLNIDVVTADNGLEALEAIDKIYFDLILMDIQMPKMDGYRATAEIRKNTDERKRETPIIALTASAFLTEKEKAKLFGMNDHVGKPFGQEDLLDKINDCLERQEKKVSK